MGDSEGLLPQPTGTSHHDRWQGNGVGKGDAGSQLPGGGPVA